MDSVKLDIELQNKIIELVGREKAKELRTLLIKYGIDLVTKVSGVEVELPEIHIQSISSRGELSIKFLEPIRRHMFVAKVNGKMLPNLQQVKLDPFSYDDPELFTVSLKVIPGMSAEPVPWANSPLRFGQQCECGHPDRNECQRNQEINGVHLKKMQGE